MNPGCLIQRTQVPFAFSPTQGYRKLMRSLGVLGTCYAVAMSSYQLLPHFHGVSAILPARLWLWGRTTFVQ